MEFASTEEAMRPESHHHHSKHGEGKKVQMLQRSEQKSYHQGQCVCDARANLLNAQSTYRLIQSTKMRVQW